MLIWILLSLLGTGVPAYLLWSTNEDANFCKFILLSIGCGLLWFIALPVAFVLTIAMFVDPPYNSKFEELFKNCRTISFKKDD